MTGVDQLRALVVAAPDDTTFTAKSLRRYLAPDANPATLAEQAMTAEQVAATVARALGMRKRPGVKAVQKWARSGYRGVVLASVPAGRGHGYSLDAVERFVKDVKKLPRKTKTRPEQCAGPMLDPADEIAQFAARGR